MKKHFFCFEETPLYDNILDFIDKVYDITKNFPKNEEYGLSNQFRRAATSVLLNYAEGWGRYSAKDKYYFYRTARSSIYECVAIIEIAKRQKYINIKEKELLYNYCLNLSKMINGLMKNVKVRKEKVK